MKLIHGVGFDLGGKYRSYENGVVTRAGLAWRSMLMRCYSDNFKISRPTYKGCTVCDEWHNFQVFADWFYGNEYSNKGYQLDKDLLVSGNKVYSADTCCFLPLELNLLLTDRANYKGSLPQGVALKKSSGRYVSQLNVDGKRVHIGYFDCENQAHRAYREAKERYVKNKALDWANRIERSAFNALMAWTVPNKCKL